MRKWLSSPSCSEATTCRLFKGMLEELEGNKSKSEFSDLVHNQLGLAGNSIEEMGFSKEQFRQLIDVYLKESFVTRKKMNEAKDNCMALLRNDKISFIEAIDYIKDYANTDKDTVITFLSETGMIKKQIEINFLN